MLLRGSGEQDGSHIDLGVVTGGSAGAAGVEHGELLLALAEALPRAERARLEQARQALVAAIGARATVDAIAVAAMFNGITRVADATGIPLDDSTRELTGGMRAQLGIDAFDRRLAGGAG